MSWTIRLIPDFNYSSFFSSNRTDNDKTVHFVYWGRYVGYLGYKIQYSTMESLLGIPNTANINFDDIPDVTFV